MARVARTSGLPVTSHTRRRSPAGHQPGILPDDFTLRAVSGGVLVGTLLCFTNLYFGLQSAWITMASLQAALVGYGLFRVLPALPRSVRRWLPGDSSAGVDRPLTPQENSVLQATASALGCMPLTVGLIGIVPALSLLDADTDGEGSEPIRLGWVSLLLWSASLAYFGVFFASPLRVPFVLREKLRFPSGTATAQLIAVLHRIRLRGDPAAATHELTGSAPLDKARHSGDGVEHVRHLHSGAVHDDEEGDDDADAEGHHQAEMERGWVLLVRSFSASAALTIASFFVPVLYALPIFDVLSPQHDLASRWGWWFTPSLSYVGQGVIMGLPTTASMCLGAVVGWGMLSPLAHAEGWTVGEPMDADTGSRAWILWPCLAVMTSESVVGLAALLVTTARQKKLGGGGRAGRYEAARGYRPLSTASDDDDVGDVDVAGAAAAATLGSGGEARGRERVVRVAGEDDDVPSRLTPAAWVTWGLAASSALAVGLLWSLFASRGIAPPTVALGIALAALLAVLGVRALGTTDLNPVNALGKLSQIAFAVAQPNNVLANMIGGALSEAGAMQASELMQDYKTGHLVQASPRGQFLGQVVGSTAGVLVSTVAYKLYESTYTIPGPEMPAPAGRLWLNFARLVNRGHLPPRALPFMVALGAVFGVTGALKSVVASRRAAREDEASRASRWDRAPRSPEPAATGVAAATTRSTTSSFSSSSTSSARIPARQDQGDGDGPGARGVRGRHPTLPSPPAPLPQPKVPGSGAAWERATDWLPNGIAFAVGLGLNTPNYSLARLVGGILAYAYQRRISRAQTASFPGQRRGGRQQHMGGEDPVGAAQRPTADADLIEPPRSSTDAAHASTSSSSSSSELPPVSLLVLSAGFVLGEGLASIAVLLLRQAGVHAATCFGCRGGCGGGCP